MVLSSCSPLRHSAQEAMDDRSHARELLLSASKENGELRNATKLACTALRSVLGTCRGISAGQVHSQLFFAT